MTPRDFSTRSARDEMRRVVGRSAPDATVGSDKDQNRRCRKKDEDHVKYLCDLYEAQAARGRHFVHELASVVNLRMKCVMKIMAMPGARTAEADLCMFGLAMCDEGGPGFVNVSVRTITNARQVGMRMTRKRTSAHRHARANANDMSEKVDQTGTRANQVAQAMEEQLKEDEQELMMWEQRKKSKDAKRIRGIVHENDRNNRTSLAHDEMGYLVHHDEQELLSLWEGWHWDDNKGGWLDPELCAKAWRRRWSTFVASTCTREFPGETCSRETGK